MNRYKDPKFKGKKLEKKGDKIVIVIPLYAGKEGREDYDIIDENLQKTGCYKDYKLLNIKFTMACYERFDAGMPYELVLVDNSTDDRNAIEYYKTLPYKLYKRENNGFSFGAYKWFWENYGKDYDFFLFHEQDFVPTKDGWLKEIYDIYLSDPEIGAVGNVMEYRHKDDPSRDLVEMQFKLAETKRDHIINLDGAFTFTSKEVLEEVDRTGWKVLDGKVAISSYNELLFTQPILELGYRMEAFGNRDFHKTERIHFYGSRKGDLTRDFDETKLVPIVDGITRRTCEQMKQYYAQKFGRIFD